MRLHPLSVVVRALRLGVTTASVVAFAGVMGGNVESVPAPLDSPLLIVALVVLGFLLGVAYHVAYYYRFEYELTPDTLDVSSGVFARQEREIPYRRVQNVDVSQNVVYRLLGVAVVGIETAGGSATEAQLNFVTEAEAARIQREVRQRRATVAGSGGGVDAGPDSGGVAPEGERTSADTGGTSVGGETLGGDRERPGDSDGTVPDSDRTGRPGGVSTERATPGGVASESTETLFELSGSELGLYALLSFKPAAIPLVLFGAPFGQDLLFRVLEPLLGPGLSSDPAGTLASAPPPRVLAAVLVTVVLGIVTSWALSALLTVLEYYGFRLGRQGEDLVYERGLLQRYSGSVPTDKIQTLAVRESVLMRRFGYAGLTVETAGYAAGQDSGGPQSAVPLAERDRVLAFARDLEPFDDLAVTRPPTVARRRYAVRYLVAVLVATGLLRVVSTVVTDFDAWYLPLAAVLLVPVAAHLKWRHRGYSLGEDHVVVRTGFWQRTTRVVPYYRLQTVVRERTVFQRRIGIANLTADTATSSLLGRRDATAFDIEAAEAERLFVECRQRLQRAIRER